MFCAASPAAKGRLIGTWKGNWIRGGDSMAVTLHVMRDSTGKYAATFDSDRLRVSGIPFSDVQVQGCCDVTMVVRGDRTTATFRGTVAGNTLKGRFVEEATEGDFAYTRATSTRPAFEERSLTFTNGDVRLSGSLLLPRGTKPVACVVFLHGSGAEGRWASRFLATQLATHGIAALIYDKRGVGQSTGDWRTATLEDLAGDAAAAVSRLRQESRIDPRRIGIHGHSQGGTLAPLVVAQSPDIAFVIGSAAAGLPTDSVEVFSVLNSLYPRAISARDSAEAREYVTELVAVAYQGRPRARLDSLASALRDRPWYFAPPALDDSYWRFSKIFGAYQPLLWWAKVRVPVLLLYGEDDQRVPARESAERIVATVLRHAPDADVTVRIFPGADHTFRLPPGPGGWPQTAPDYVPSLLRWLAAR
jgi:pimeloyl-ACP methyl ester carboxylesterase